MIGVVLAVPLSRGLGKKSTYIATMAALAVLSILFFLSALHTGGLLDDADYANRHIYLYGYRFTVDMEYVCRRFGLCRTERRTASTGLIFSSSSMAQKFGGAMGGAAVMWILASFGYNTAEGAVQTEGGADRSEPAYELDTGCRGNAGYGGRVLLSVDEEARGGD